MSRREGRAFEELITLHALDGFLARLSNSSHRDRLILKGGLLLAALDLRRPTRDVDLLAQELNINALTVLNLVREIAAIPFDDGISFETDDAQANDIRDDDDYAGVRVSLKARFGTAIISFHVDVNVGDPVTPTPAEIVLPRLWGESVKILGYPISMVYAEKLVTAISRGTANTRWRDFGDIYSLTGRYGISAEELIISIKTVAKHRAVNLVPLSDVLSEFAVLAQTRYFAWRRKSSRLDLPDDVQQLLNRAVQFSDPLISGSVNGLSWSPESLEWK
jgi:hypothetical protein